MRHTFITGDGIKELLLIPDKSIDLIFADLPYGTTKAPFDKRLDLDLLWAQYKRIITPNAAILLFSQSPFDKVLYASNPKMFRYEWIWEKTSATGFLNAKKMPLKAHENILVFYNKLPIYNPQMSQGHPRKVSSIDHKRNSKKTVNYGDHNLSGYDSTERYPRSVVKFKSDKQKQSLHPQQKPVDLLAYLIRTYTNRGMTVLDNTAGSGSIGEACEITYRNSIQIDNDPANILVFEKRMLKYPNAEIAKIQPR